MIRYLEVKDFQEIIGILRQLHTDSDYCELKFCEETVLNITRNIYNCLDQDVLVYIKGEKIVAFCHYGKTLRFSGDYCGYIYHIYGDKAAMIDLVKFACDDLSRGMGCTKVYVDGSLSVGYSYRKAFDYFIRSLGFTEISSVYSKEL
jgi:hypothetical protein